MTDYTAQISAYIEKEREILSCLNICQINAVMNLLEEKLAAEIRYLFWKRRSAATASHYQNDFIKEFQSIPDKNSFPCPE